MKKLYYILIPLLAPTMFSCHDILDENPPHLNTRKRLYTSATGFQQGVNGLYGLMRTERDCSRYVSELYWGDYTGATAFGATDDYLCGQTGTQGNLVKNPSSYLLPGQNAVKDLFAWYYAIINAANTILEDAEHDEVDWTIGGVDHHDRIVGETLAARAWAYRSLVYYWGPVPLKLDASDGSNVRTDFTRDSEDKVQLQMVKDLTQAAKYISWTPYATGSMTKGVALHYLSETYLALAKRALDANRAGDAQQYYTQAERYASILIGDGAISQEDLETFGTSNRSLESDFNAMFNPTKVDYSVNSETLWTWQWALNAVGGGANSMRYAFVTYYTRSRSGFGNARDYDNSNISPAQTEERGGQGWCELAITPRVMSLYYNSSTTTAPPASNNTDENKAYWEGFKYEDRGNDRALRKYFILNKETDLMTNPNKINPTTTKVWSTGDTIWISAGSADASQRHLAMGMDFRKMSYNRYRYVYTMKYAYCDPGRSEDTDTHYNQMYLRLAETILLRAEARVFLGNVGGAADDINKLRDRANALPVSISDFGDGVQSQVDFVLDERTRELLCEEQRRFTLIRLGRKEYLYRRAATYNPSSSDGTTIINNKQAIYFPIPQSVIDSNLTLPMEQNPGYSGVPINGTGWPTITAWTMPS